MYPTSVSTDGIEVSVDIQPFQMGKNDVTIHVENENETEMAEVRTTFFMFPSWRMHNTAFPIGNGEYQLTGNFLHGPGAIFLEVEAVHMNGEISTFPFRIQVPGNMPEDVQDMYGPVEK